MLDPVLLYSLAGLFQQYTMSAYSRIFVFNILASLSSSF